MSRKTTILSSTLFTIALVSSSFANAQDQNNPLHPSYYMGKTTAVAISTADGTKQYVDNRNPLHPSYAQAGSGAWQSTGTGSVQAYVDNRNPLHPSFVR
jgi:hypothetical protein